jgi:hypothetical protein
MNTTELQNYPNNVKVGDVCSDVQPNITESTIFTINGEVVGFYLKKIPERLEKFIGVANAEFLTDRVPKETMNRGPVGSNKWKAEQEASGIKPVQQYSTILGSCAPKPHMRLPYPRMAMVHQQQSARTFVKAMLLACNEAEKAIAEICPELYEKQLNIINEKVPPKWRFGKLFTSSISNFNIAASYHRDAGNLEGCANVIITKRHNARGGNLTVPDYGVTMDSCDNSMLVYPAWRNIHGVTPIRPTEEGGYRNSLIFYPLKAFSAYW